jgi:hypothetical protein
VIAPPSVSHVCGFNYSGLLYDFITTSAARASLVIKCLFVATQRCRVQVCPKNGRTEQRPKRMGGDKTPGGDPYFGDCVRLAEKNKCLARSNKRGAKPSLPHSS